MWFVWFLLVSCYFSKTLTFPQYISPLAVNQNEPSALQNYQKPCPFQRLDQPGVYNPCENVRRREFQSLPNYGNAYPALMSDGRSVFNVIDANTPLKVAAAAAPAAIMDIVSPQSQNFGSFSPGDQQVRYVREVVQSALPYLQDKTQARYRRKAKSCPAQLVPILTNVPIDQLTPETVDSLVRDARDIESYIAETASIQQPQAEMPMVSQNQPMPPLPLVHTSTGSPVKPKESEVHATNDLPVRGDTLYYMQMQSFNFMNTNEDNSKMSHDVKQEAINDSTDGKQSIEQYDKSFMEPIRLQQMLQQLFLQQIAQMMKEQATDGDAWRDFDEKNVQEASTEIVKEIDSQKNRNEQITESSPESLSTNKPSSANTESNLRVTKTNS